MTDQPNFRTPEAEVIRLLDELSAMRDLLREISGKVSRLEMRAKRAFPIAAQAHFERTKTRKDAEGTATINGDQALEHYDRVVEAAKAGSFEQAAMLLSEMSFPDLMLIHREVGLTMGNSKPSKKAVVNALLGRVKESVLLTRHSSRPLDGA